MSSTIYGGKTFNNMNVDDMVDDNRDYVYRYPGNNQFFARLSGTRESYKDTQKPALVLFCEEEPFIPLYAMELEGTFADYMDKYGCLRGDQIEEPVKNFWELVGNLSLDRLKDYMRKCVSDKPDSNSISVFNEEADQNKEAPVVLVVGRGLRRSRRGR